MGGYEVAQVKVWLKLKARKKARKSINTKGKEKRKEEGKEEMEGRKKSKAGDRNFMRHKKRGHSRQGKQKWRKGSEGFLAKVSGVLPPFVKEEYLIIFSRLRP